MSTKYTMTLWSTVSDPWKFAIWKQFPEITGAIPVAWKCVGVAPGTTANPTPMKITWFIRYGVFLQDPATQVSPNTIWESTQSRDTVLGSKWEVKDLTMGPDDSVQSLNQTGTNPSGGTVSVQNNSKSLASVGFGMDGNVMCVVPQMKGGVIASGTFKPTYFIGVFQNLKTSQTLDVSMSLSPLEVKYGEGETNLDYTLKMVGNTLTLELGKPVISGAFTAPSALSAKGSMFSLSAGDVNASVFYQKLASADLQARLAEHGCSIQSLSLPAPGAKAVEVQAVAKDHAVFEKTIRAFVYEELPSVKADQFQIKVKA